MRCSQFLQSLFLSLVCLTPLQPAALLADEGVSPDALVSVTESHFSIRAPKGWTVSRGHGSSLTFEDLRNPGQSRKIGRSPFVPTMTVALSRTPHPIDEQEMEALRVRIQKEFSVGVQNFRIVETRFVDYRGNADAILVYSQFRKEGVLMNQMHLFLSGRQDSALLTYTQIEDDFGSELREEDIWKAMMSSEIEGSAPFRYRGLVQAGGLFTVLSLLSSALIVLRRRAPARDSGNFEFEFAFEHEDEAETWKATGTHARRLPTPRTNSGQGLPIIRTINY